MEKIKIGKHNHTFTDLLKVLIFALVMLAPFGAVISKCLYVATNKNAKDSYYGETINEKQLVVLQDYDYVFNQNYIFRNEILTIQPPSVSTNYFYVSNVINLDNNQTIQCDELRFYPITDHITFELRNGGAYVNSFNLNTTMVNYQFTYKSRSNNNLLNILPYFYTLEYNKDSYLDNVFYYSVRQLPQTQIFGWTKNTALYTGIETMTQGLGFDPNNNVLALLLTYWSLNTIIYIIFDIVIKAFTTLTHMIGNK